MDLVPVKVFDNYFSASVCLTKLEDAGYECYLKDETTATLLPGIGGIKLMARDTEKDKVIELLEQFDKEYLESAKCPKCGKTEFAYVAKPGTTILLLEMLDRLFSNDGAVNYTYQCGNCGYETERLPEDIDPNELLQ